MKLLQLLKKLFKRLARRPAEPEKPKLNAYLFNYSNDYFMKDKRRKK